MLSGHSVFVYIKHVILDPSRFGCILCIIILYRALEHLANASSRIGSAHDIVQ